MPGASYSRGVIGSGFRAASIFGAALCLIACFGPNECDVQASDPEDPNRAAPGVEFARIVPRVAVEECRRAVADFPDVARFKYQLGRALMVSKKNEDAVRAFQAAAKQNYGMAFVVIGRLWEADNMEYAATAYKAAVEAGIDATKLLDRVVFRTDGYSSPEFFRAVYAGGLKGKPSSAQILYVQEFMMKFVETEVCSGVIDSGAYVNIVAKASASAIGQIFGGLVNSARQRSGDLGEAFQQGVDAGREVMSGLAVQVQQADGDARLFYGRHGCDTPVAKKFFTNLQTWAAD